MRLTTGMLSAAYDLLRQTRPFDKWALPDSEEVRFAVLRTRRKFGDCDTKSALIRLSSAQHTRLSGVLATMAHEMVHLHMQEAGARKDSSRHGPAFKRLAAQVCRYHPEFDPVGF